MRINRQDTNGVKPLLAVGELGYDNYPAGGDVGRVYVGTGSVNIPQAKKAEVVAVDEKVYTHTVRVDNPHSVTKTQVGLSNVDNTADSAKPVSTAQQTALNLKANIASPVFTGNVTGLGVATGTSFNSITGLSSTLPVVNGVATIGTSTEVAKADHIHPSDTTKVDKVTSTDNAIVRFDGTTGAVQNSGVTIDDSNNVIIGTNLDNNTRRIGFTTAAGGSSAIESVTIGVTYQDLVFKTTYATESEKMRITGQGNVLVTGGGGLGYGTGSGGTVTQLTSKSTTVTLNKPSGQIIVNNAALAAGALVYFMVSNSLFSANDTVIVNFKGGGIEYASYRLGVTSDGASGYFYIHIENRTGTSKSEAVQIKYEIIKGAVS